MAEFGIRSALTRRKTQLVLIRITAISILVALIGVILFMPSIG